MQDVGFALETYLAERFAIRIARAAMPHFTNGVGTTQPWGVLTRAASAGTAVGAISNDGTSAANTLGTDDFATLEASVDPAYRRNAVWMVHSNTLAALRKVKDKNGRPVFPDLHAGGEDRIINYPVITNPNMGQLQAAPSSPQVASITVAFGDFSKYLIRRAPSAILRLEERPIDYSQTWFILFSRMDGDLIDGGGGAVKTLQNLY